MDPTLVLKNFKFFLTPKSWKKTPQIHSFFLNALTTQTAQTEEFMLQNVAYWSTVYRAGVTVQGKQFVNERVANSQNNYLCLQIWPIDLYKSKNFDFCLFELGEISLYTWSFSVNNFYWAVDARFVKMIANCLQLIISLTLVKNIYNEAYRVFIH